MPRKTLALISGLILVTVILFVIALNNSRTPITSTPEEEHQAMEDGPHDPDYEEPDSTQANSVLSLNPQPVVVMPGKSGSAEVNIDTAGNEVTAVQLEIAYDPNFITNVKVTPGQLFDNPVVLIDKNDVKEGRYTFAFGILPNQSAVVGSGSTATISFTALNKPGNNSQLALLPTSLVTARGVSNSVLKLASGTLIEISQP
jgi:hypothetical protein